jgi:hypothetical protein
MTGTADQEKLVSEWWEKRNAQTQRRVRWTSAARILSYSVVCAVLLYAEYLVLFR